MEGLSEDSIGEGQGAAEQGFVLHAGEPAQFCLVGKDRAFGHQVGENEFRSGSEQPRPALGRGDCCRMLPEKCQPNGGNRRDHGHAYLPRIQHDEGSGLAASHDGGHARCSLGWGSIHRCGGQGFGSQRRRCGMTRLVK